MNSQAKVTMVAFHGRPKPKRFSNLLQRIHRIHRRIKRIVRKYDKVRFKEYDEKQLHATIIGMEAVLVERVWYGYWLIANKKRVRAIETELLLKKVRKHFGRKSSLKIRFGGFKEGYCSCRGKAAMRWRCRTGKSQFHSCGKTPYESSFAIYKRHDGSGTL